MAVLKSAAAVVDVAVDVAVHLLLELLVGGDAGAAETAGNQLRKGELFAFGSGGAIGGWGILSVIVCKGIYFILTTSSKALTAAANWFWSSLAVFKSSLTAATSRPRFSGIDGFFLIARSP